MRSLLMLAAALIPIGGFLEAGPPSPVACLGTKPAAKLSLPAGLREISGLTVTDDGRILAHGDESARIHQVDYRAGTIVKTFGLGPTTPRGDFEAIAAAGSRIFLITSGGQLYEFAEGAGGAVVTFTMTDTKAGALCEIEGMAWDPGNKALLLLCKTPRLPALQHTLTLLRWSPDSKRWLSPDRISIPLSAEFRNAYGPEFRGTDLARDPVTGNFLAIAGLSRAAALISPDGKLIEMGQLGKHHPQAEGVAILKDGTLLVSDEGGKGAKGAGKLTVYACGR